MPRGKRSPGQTQITISLSEEMLKRIDEERLTEKFKPSRSAWIVAELSAALETSRKRRSESNFKVAGELPDAPADGPSSFSARKSPRALPPPSSDITLNEQPPSEPSTHQPSQPPRMTRNRAAIRNMTAREKNESTP